MWVLFFLAESFVPKGSHTKLQKKSSHFPVLKGDVGQRNVPFPSVCYCDSPEAKDNFPPGNILPDSLDKHYSGYFCAVCVGTVCGKGNQPPYSRTKECFATVKFGRRFVHDQETFCLTGRRTRAGC